MKIDERIIDGAKPFTLYDTDKAKAYLNKECYFSDGLDNFVDVKRYCSVGKLVEIIENGEFPFKISGHDVFFAFCLPCEWVKKEDDRERLEREAEIMRIDLLLFAYAKNRRYTLGDKFYRKFALRNAMILDYGKTYGTEAQERLREKLDDAHTKLLPCLNELE